MHSDTLYADLMAALVCSFFFVNVFGFFKGVQSTPQPPPPQPPNPPDPPLHRAMERMDCEQTQGTVTVLWLRRRVLRLRTSISNSFLHSCYSFYQHRLLCSAYVNQNFITAPSYIKPAILISMLSRICILPEVRDNWTREIVLERMFLKCFIWLDLYMFPIKVAAADTGRWWRGQ